MKKRELVRIDYIMYNEREFKIGSTLFCSQMQKEDQIYLTKTFNDIYNENFKNNIKKYLEILKS
jgi:predicted metal-dependent HD superfamily phosphohydrolase